ncbi:MAG: DUF302 domain-containing protein [Candidatus Micrarchaeaceae archaeon]
MDITDFAYVAGTSKGFDEAVVSVLKAAERKGWSLFQVYDLRERLASKAFAQEPLKVIEICNGRHASQLLGRDRLASLCMPCKINVLEEGGKVRIASMKPAMMSQLFPDISQKDIEDVEKDLKEIVDNAV